MSKSTKKLYKENWSFSDIPDLTNKIMIVTGSNRGLGFFVAREIVIKGAHVIMAVRNIDEGEKSKNIILTDNPNAKIDVIKLDLADLHSITTFTNEFKEKFSRLDVLLNNAGITAGIKLTPHTPTVDGFEYFFGVNHLGTFALTGQLFDILKQTPNSRIVTVSSLSHKQGSINFDDLMSEKKYSNMRIYAQSKLANLLFGYELSRHIAQQKLNIKSVLVHPGFAISSKKKQGFWINLGKKLLAQSGEKGSLPFLYGMVGPDIENGDYIGPSKLFGVRGYPKRTMSNKKSYNEQDAKRLWEISQDLTHITYQF